MLNIDGDQISIGIDLDQGARLASVQWRDMQFAVPFAGDPRGGVGMRWRHGLVELKMELLKIKMAKRFNCQPPLIHHMQFMVMASSPLGRILAMANNY